MPQAKSGRSSSESSTGARSAGAQPKRGATRSSPAGKRAPRSTGAQGRSTTAPHEAQASDSDRVTGSSDARLDAAAQRLRKLNERIIEAGKDAGEVTLSSYEKALKTIASMIERGPGSSDVEWISELATIQAKFIRDMTEAWTSAARGMLK